MNDDTTRYIAIERLQRAYADMSTRRAFGEVASIATPDAFFSFDTHSGNVFEINGPAEFAEFGAKMTAGFNFYEYIPLNFTVTFAADGVTASGRSFNLEVAEPRDTDDWLEFYGTYKDQYALFEGEWRFARRDYATFGRRTSGTLQAYALEEEK